jgi:hypothetical protein
MSPRAADARPSARAPAWRALLGASAWRGTAIGWSARHHLSRAVKQCDPAQGDLRPRVTFRPEVGAEPYCRSSSPRHALVHRVVVPPWEHAKLAAAAAAASRPWEAPQRPCTQLVHVPGSRFVRDVARLTPFRSLSSSLSSSALVLLRGSRLLAVVVVVMVALTGAFFLLVVAGAVVVVFAVAVVITSTVAAAAAAAVVCWCSIVIRSTRCCRIAVAGRAVP